MRISRRGWRQALVRAALVGFLPGAWARAANVPSLVTQPVNNARRVILKGNVHPLARPQYDHGLAPDSLPMERMLLVLKRSKQQQAALDELLTGQQEKSSPEYHHWLTPVQFGKEFGPSDSDIQAVTDWLASEGFQVNHVANGRTVIEFSGTAGLMRQVFFTEIHKYVVKGKSYWANASNPQIPAALAPVVKGIASLNNFPRKPLNRPVGVFSRSKSTGKIKPLSTINCPSGYTCSGSTFYGLGPTDFATIYNVLPLWSTGTDGTGETIAIVSNSNINTQDVANFRSMFGLPSNPVNVILNGPDPGLIPDSETEADADTEWAGAVAKNATIDLVVSEDTESTAGIDLSALYIIDNNLAPILSESYGSCESALGNAGNAFENAMWQQAAAEGITVLVASGDNGSAGCDDPNLEDAAQFGLAVSGSASTPNNVAVGGTDFDNPSSYFSTTNDSTTQASAKSYVPEITWNDSCARSGQSTGCSTLSSSGQDLVAGGGGESNCAVEDSSGNCSGGYSKPVWQTGEGVPADSVRDVPDVSLFASDGFDNAFYVVCESDQMGFIGVVNASCGSGMANFDFMGIGGTSLSTPAFAGIMALVDQKTGHRQGNANFVLYPLAAAAAKNSDDCTSNADAVSNASCIFYDITQGHNASGTDLTPGNNSVACVAGSPDCDAPTGYSDGILVQPGSSSTPSPAWTTSAGYDLATGLGSVNVANLVNNWGSVSFHSSATTLTLGPTTLTHGQSVAASISVTSSAGTPTGDVELMGNPITATNPSGTNNIGIATFTLGSGGTVTGTTNMLPGGTYNVFAHYAGDGTSGSSDSTPPITVTVNPENSQTQMSFVTFTTPTGTVSGTSPTPPAVYGSSFYFLRVDVLNSAGNPCAPLTSDGLQVQPTSGCPTGTVLVNNSSNVSAFNGSLNSQGYVESQLWGTVPSSLLPAGTGTLVANYSGDASFNASSQTLNYTIAKAPTTLSFSETSPVQYGDGVPAGARVNTTSLGTYPGGTFTLFVDGAQYGNPVYADTAGDGNQYTSPPAYAYAISGTFSGPPLSVGTYTLSMQYTGDSNYVGSETANFSMTVEKNQPYMWVDVNPYSIATGQNTTLSVEVRGGLYGAPPTGTVSFTDGGNTIPGTVAYTTTSQNDLDASMRYAPSTAGTHDISASYSGDSNYASATPQDSAVLTVETPGFQITGSNFAIAAPGKSGSTPIGIAPVGSFTGNVDLTCAVTTAMSVPTKDMPTCSLNPTSVTLASSQVSSTLTVNTIAPSLAPPAPPGAPPAGRWPLGLWLGLLGMLGLAALAWSRRRGVSAFPPTLSEPGNLKGSSTFRWGLLVFTTILLGGALWGSCGGGGGGSTGGSSSSSGNSFTPVGIYTLTVTGTSGSVTNTATITLTVQ